jgi:hypothetical protein
MLPRETRQAWASSLPSMLWHLGARRPETTRLVVRTLLAVARRQRQGAGRGFSLAQPSGLGASDSAAVAVPPHCARLARSLVPFFYARRKGDGLGRKAHVVGPFLSMPADTQRAAVAAVFHLGHFPSTLLRGLAVVAGAGEAAGASFAVAAHVLGVVRSAYESGRVATALYLSFLLGVLFANPGFLGPGGKVREEALYLEGGGSERGAPVEPSEIGQEACRSLRVCAQTVGAHNLFFVLRPALLRVGGEAPGRALTSRIAAAVAACLEAGEGADASDGADDGAGDGAGDRFLVWLADRVVSAIVAREGEELHGVGLGEKDAERARRAVTAGTTAAAADAATGRGRGLVQRSFVRLILACPRLLAVLVEEVSRSAASDPEDKVVGSVNAVMRLMSAPALFEVWREGGGSSHASGLGLKAKVEGLIAALPAGEGSGGGAYKRAAARRRLETEAALLYR